MTDQAKLQIHLKDWLRIGEELFGSRRQAWRFRCPSCGHEQSHDEVKARRPDVGDTSNWIHYSCEGRHNPSVGCDWTLGGLFRVHTLEVFDPNRSALVACFEFAHERARKLCEIAAGTFAVPEHPTTDAERWEDFTWPDWVPHELRAQVEKFWSASDSRGPRDWLRSASVNRAPTLGARVQLSKLCSSRGEHEEGRYVHAWNNIGRVVRDDGTIGYVSV